MKEKKLKIFIVSDYNTGGAGHVAKASGEIFKSKGIDIEYLFGNEYFKKGILSYLFNSNAYYIVFKKIVELKPDVIMLHNFDNLLSPLILRAFIKYKKNNPNVKVIFTVHDYHMVSASNSLTYYNCGNKFFFENVPSFIDLINNNIDKRSRLHSTARIIQWYFYYYILNYSNVIDAFFCPSKFIEDKVRFRYGSKTIKLVENPISFNKKIIRNEIDDDIIRIAFVGRLSVDKGIYSFLTQVNKYAKLCNNNIEFIIIGGGEHYDDIQLLSSKTPENIKITLCGQVDSEQVQLKLTSSDYILLPSIVYENAPLSLIEGISCGCKVITMNFGGMKEIGQSVPYSILMEDVSKESIVGLFSKINKHEYYTDDFLQSYICKFSNDSYFDKFIEVTGLDEY